MYAQLPSSLSLSLPTRTLCVCVSHIKKKGQVWKVCFLDSLQGGRAVEGKHFIWFFFTATTRPQKEEKEDDPRVVPFDRLKPVHISVVFIDFLSSCLLFSSIGRADSNLKIQLIYIITVESESNSLISNGNGINVQIGRRHRWIYVSFAASTVVLFLIGKENKEEEQTTERQQKLKRK